MTESAYQKAGVDIYAGADLVEKIKPHVKKTDRSGVMSGLGGFGGFFDLKQTGYEDPLLVSATDGVGTKLKIAIESNQHATIGQDLVAMCVNDIIVSGAEPLFFLDYFATSKLDVEGAAEIIAGIADGCEISGCALIGGETAEMPGLYAKGDYDLAGFAVGAVERDQVITGEDIQAGSVIIGLASSGLHSNGFSLVRKILEKTGLKYTDPSPFEPTRTVAESLLVPTEIYVRSVLGCRSELHSKYGNDVFKNGQGLQGIAHITGGGFIENIPRIIPEQLSVEIDVSQWTIPPVFSWLAEQGSLTVRDMAETFNCGIGMILVCHPDHADDVLSYFKEQKVGAFSIGQVTALQDQRVVLKNEDLLIK